MLSFIPVGAFYCLKKKKSELLTFHSFGFCPKMESNKVQKDCDKHFYSCVQAGPLVAVFLGRTLLPQGHFILLLCFFLYVLF